MHKHGAWEWEFRAIPFALPFWKSPGWIIGLDAQPDDGWTYRRVTRSIPHSTHVPLRGPGKRNRAGAEGAVSQCCVL